MDILKKPLLFLLTVAFAFAAEVRIKDIAVLADAQANPIYGYGLVIGLRHTGDSTKSFFTQEAMSNALKRLDMDVNPKEIKSKNIASVIVTAELPAFAKKGQKLDVTISSIGDASSLRGGILLVTQMRGSDGTVYALAQGPVTVGGINIDAKSSYSAKNSTNTGRVINGAIVQNEIKVDLTNQNYLVLNLRQPDFITAARLKVAIEESNIAFCDNYDASTVRVILTPEHKNDLVQFISTLEQIKIEPDTLAKIVVSERTGTVVIGEKVQISPVAISHGNLNIKVEKDVFDIAQIVVDEPDSGLKTIETGDTLKNLVKSLNALGTKPRDLIIILQAIKAAGAISAPIEVI
jgi:flagellar P-ring protein FlgI